MNTIFKSALLCGVLLLGAAAHAEESATAPAPAEKPWLPKDPPKHDPVSGSFSSRMEVEHAGGESDWRSDQYLRMTIQPSATPKLSIHGAAWLWEDLDGKEPADSALRGLNDTYAGAVQVRPLYLYLEGKDLWGDSTLRIGRQRIEESVNNSLVDGAYFSKRVGIWEGYAFLGYRGTLYEDYFQDPSLGAGLSVRPTAYTRLAVDAYYSTESRDRLRRSFYADLFSLRYPLAIPDDADTRQLAFTVTQRLGERHQLYARYLVSDGASDEFRLAATGSFSSRHVAYDVAYVQRLNTVTDRSNDTTGFYRVLGALSEYRDLSATVHVPIAERYAFSVESQWHDSQDSGDFNRDYTRYGAFFSGAKLWGGNLDFRLGVSRWDLDGGEGTWSLTGEATRRWGKNAFTLGADYAAYQDRYTEYRPLPLQLTRLVVDLLPGIYPGYNVIAGLAGTGSVTTDQDVYSLYAKYGYTLNDRQSLWFKLICQLDDGPDSPYWRAQAEYTIRF